MDPLKLALKEQYHAALAMLADCVEKCTDDLWTTPSRKDVDPDHPNRFCVRSFWRIAFHGIFFTHLYLAQNEDVKEFYLGISSGERKSFRDTKFYRRRKRWLA